MSHAQPTLFAFAPPTEGGDGDEGYESVEGVDPTTMKLKREYEAEVEHKVASDYAHIVLAYGAIWVLFVGYGIFLWIKHQRLRADLDELSRRVRKGS